MASSPSPSRPSHRPKPPGRSDVPAGLLASLLMGGLLAYSSFAGCRGTHTYPSPPKDLSDSLLVGIFGSILCFLFLLAFPRRRP